jgi:hypothetical protein
VGSILELLALANVRCGSHPCHTNAAVPGQPLCLLPLLSAQAVMRPATAGPNLAATSFALWAIGLVGPRM